MGGGGGAIGRGKVGWGKGSRKEQSRAGKGKKGGVREEVCVGGRRRGGGSG